MEILLHALLFGFIAGMVAAIYKEVLAYEKVLNWWFRWGQKFEKKTIYQPIWGCVRCISGQIGLWSWVIFEISPYLWLDDQLTYEWLFLIYGLIIAICFAIFTAINVAQLIHYYENK